MIPAVPATGNGDSGVMFDFAGIEIGSFVKIVSELTGENYVIDPSVAGKITVTSPKPIPREAVASVFQAVLDVYGYAAIRDGDIIKIIPVARAKQAGYIQGQAGDGDSLLETRVFNLKSADVSEIRTLIQPLLSRAGNVAVYPATRTIVLTDQSRNVNRLQRIIHSLDEAGPEFRQDVISLQHADAGNVAEALNALFNTSRPGTTSRPVIVPETRANVLLIHANDSDFIVITGLLEKLDQPMPESRAGVRVRRLAHADAEDLARTLSSQFNLTAPSDNTSRDRTGATPAAVYSIVPDKTTNSLIITAAPEHMRTIDTVIDQLDLPRKQILVEALIVEISSDLTRDLGIEWRLTDEISPDGVTVVGGTNLPTDGSQSALGQMQQNPYNVPQGIAFGLVKGTISFGGVEFANIGALARAMETSSGVNILSTPHIMTLDNEEAEIIVGEERPFLTSSQSMDTGAIVRTYEFKDIGLTMRMTPRITGDNQIQMELFQEIKNFVAESDIGAVTTTKRQARTTIRIADSQMAAIGGLIREDQLDQVTQVPCLGNIPFIGYLFKGDRKTRTKSNLLIFITPYIIADIDAVDQMTSPYKKQIPELHEDTGIPDLK